MNEKEVLTTLSKTNTKQDSRLNLPLDQQTYYLLKQKQALVNIALVVVAIVVVSDHEWEVEGRLMAG